MYKAKLMQIPHSGKCSKIYFVAVADFHKQPSGVQVSVHARVQVVRKKNCFNTAVMPEYSQEVIFNWSS